MRTCIDCKQELPFSDFSFVDKSKTRYSYQCKPCLRKRSKEHYEKNKTTYIERAKRNNEKTRKENQQKLWDYYKAHPCVDCGSSNPVVLEADHLRDKTEGVSGMVWKRSWSKILAELEKCEVRCANCHRIKTAEQLDWYKDIIK